MSSDMISNYEQIGTSLSVKDTDTLQQMGEVMSVLSKYDALSIFVLAKNGLKSELDTPQKIGLTKKQYYTRLKQLYDLKLITKNDNAYVHTTFGNIVYEKHIVGLVNSIVNIKELEMIDVLKRSSKFDAKEISSFLTRIGIDDKIIATSSKPQTTIVSTYEDMVTKAIEIVEFAQKEIILMVRYPNELIINSMLKKANMGVEVKVLADVNMVGNYLSNESSKMQVRDKNNDERMKVVTNPFYPLKLERKYTKVPFSVIMTDGMHVGVEIVDRYNPEKFVMAVYSEDSSICKHMKNVFNGLWHVASMTPPQLATKNE